MTIISSLQFILLMTIFVINAHHISAFPSPYQSHRVSPLLGVAQADIDRYTPSSPSSKFKCIPDDIDVHYENVNDNYCDCIKSGEDEPGTSACSFGHFACANKGFHELIIPSSFVNDGICDCCDGSDENGSIVQCQNTCNDLAEVRRQQFSQRLDFVLQGLLARQEMMTHTILRIQQYQNRLEEIDPILDEAEAKLDLLQVSLDEANRSKRQFEDMSGAQDNEKENLTQNSDNSEKTTLNGESIEEKDSSDANTETLQTTDDQLNQAFPYPKEYLFQTDNDVVDDESVALATEKNTDSSFDDTVYESQNKPSEYDKQVDKDFRDQGDQDQQSHIEWSLMKTLRVKFAVIFSFFSFSSGDLAVSIVQEDDISGIIDEKDWLKTPERIAIRLTELSRMVEQAHELHRAHQQSVNSIQEEKSRITKMFATDNGMDDVFFSLHGQCFQLNSQPYVYELCMFDQIQQKEGSSATSLGTFSHWSNEHTEQMYSNGQACWKGPARSTRVFLVCGIESALLSVMEPTKCVYEMRFSTPAACTSAERDHLQRNFDALLLSNQDQKTSHSLNGVNKYDEL